MKEGNEVERTRIYKVMCQKLSTSCLIYYFAVHYAINGRGKITNFSKKIVTIHDKHGEPCKIKNEEYIYHSYVRHIKIPLVCFHIIYYHLNAFCQMNFLKEQLDSPKYLNDNLYKS